MFTYAAGKVVEEDLIAGITIGSKAGTEDLENANYVGKGIYVAQWLNPNLEKASCMINFMSEVEGKLCETVLKNSVAELRSITSSNIRTANGRG